MLWKTTILYIISWLIYAIFFFFCFPLWGISAAIPFFVLIGVGAWLYGTRAALWLYCMCLVYHAYVLSIHYGDLFTPYQTKLSSTVVIISISYVLGCLRRNLDAIRELNQKLEQRVAQRNADLSNLTAHLLKESETLKTRRAESLHDGIGQQLTGIQLLSSSLYEGLLGETDPTSALADYLRSRSAKIHNQIRKISRFLFPMRIDQVGLVSALKELSSVIEDLKKVTFQIVEPKEFQAIPDDVSLQLYRICQETSLYAIDHLGADHFSIQLSENNKSWCIRLHHNCINSEAQADVETDQLLDYRLKQISGSILRYKDKAEKRVIEIHCLRDPFHLQEATS